MPEQHDSLSRKAGYAALIEHYDLAVIPNWHQSFISVGKVRRVEIREGVTVETYPVTYQPGDGLGNHLEFALKYDGTNLAILASLFAVADPAELEAYVLSKPKGKYARRIWFLYEMLTNSKLPIEDLKAANYIDLLDPDLHFTATSSRPCSRQKINDNLLGTREFCPTIRRTEALQNYLQVDIHQQCERVMSGYSPALLNRALRYLYTKETKSSFEIEHLKPSADRTERFVGQLQLAEKEDFCEKARLIDLQNRIVDPRFQERDYRSVQNYVGETVDWTRERIHYACPKPENLNSLMTGLIDSHRRMEKDDVAVVIHAAAIAYGFVFLHPFEDGNGRIHRFLMHNILARRGLTPPGIMFPLSATMLKSSTDYDASLEAFSRPLMTLVQYSLNEQGEMTVANDTARWYAYIDMTAQAEALYQFIEQTIHTELERELIFLARYDKTKRAIQEIIDMPDRQIDLFIRFCLQNHGRLSANKRSRNFEFLLEDELAAMEHVIQTAYGDDPAEP